MAWAQSIATISSVSRVGVRVCSHRCVYDPFVDQAPVVQRPDNFILWISHYPTVLTSAKISVFPLVQANMHTLTTVKLGSVRKPWTTFNVKYILDPE